MIKGRAHIIGLGKSGEAAARLLLRNGWKVLVSEKSNGGKFDSVISDLIGLGAVIFLGGHDNSLDIEVDLAVASPGVKLDAEVLRALQAKKVPVISELELGWRFCKGNLVAITGTNGKTTTTALLGNIFSCSSDDSFTCGNIGFPLCDIADKTTNNSMLAVEVSSFQLMTIEQFRPKVSVLLNLADDHLDWHGGFDNYARAKTLIWKNQTDQDWLVYNADDPFVSSMVREAEANLFPFSLSMELEHGASYRSGELRVRIDDHKEFRFNRAQLQLLGNHNVANALAAISAALLSGVDHDSIQKGLMTFQSYPHRLETVRELDGVKWINDSKATNVEAGVMALRAVESPIILIAGGRAKGGGFRALRNGPTERIKTAVLLGEAADEIAADINNKVETVRARDMRQAVKIAESIATAGDTVLLSPLCASYDMYENYEERGDEFRLLVEELSGV